MISVSPLSILCRLAKPCFSTKATKLNNLCSASLYLALQPLLWLGLVVSLPFFEAVLVLYFRKEAICCKDL